jgi:hypothetical protein
MMCDGILLHRVLSPDKHALMAVLQHLGGILPPHLGYSPARKAIQNDWLWSVGGHPLSWTSWGGAYSQMHIDALHRCAACVCVFVGVWCVLWLWTLGAAVHAHGIVSQGLQQPGCTDASSRMTRHICSRAQQATPVPRRPHHTQRGRARRTYILDAIDSSVDLVNDAIMLLQDAAPNEKLFKRMQAMKVLVHACVRMCAWHAQAWKGVWLAARLCVSCGSTHQPHTDNGHNHNHPQTTHTHTPTNSRQGPLQQLLQQYAQIVNVWRSMVQQGASLDYDSAAESITHCEHLSRAFIQHAQQVRCVAWAGCRDTAQGGRGGGGGWRGGPAPSVRPHKTQPTNQSFN